MSSRYTRSNVHIAHIMAWHIRLAWFKADRVLALRRRSSHGVLLPVSKKLPATDTHWQRRNLFSPVASHWVYHWHFRAGPILSSRYPMRNEVNDIFMYSLFQFALSCYFCLIGLLLLLIFIRFTCLFFFFFFFERENLKLNWERGSGRN